MPLAIITIIIVILVMVGLIVGVTENSLGTFVVCWGLALPLVVWLIVASQQPFEGYESKTYAIHQIEDAQVAKVDGSFININSRFGKVATPTQELKVTEPTSTWAGGIKWQGFYTKYELVEKEK